MSDALLGYLRERNAERQRDWVPFPRYGRKRTLLIRMSCGHTEAFYDDAPSAGMWRCPVCWQLRVVTCIHKPSFVTPGPSKGRRW